MDKMTAGITLMSFIAEWTNVPTLFVAMFVSTGRSDTSASAIMDTGTVKMMPTSAKILTSVQRKSHVRKLV